MAPSTNTKIYLNALLSGIPVKVITDESKDMDTSLIEEVRSMLGFEKVSGEPTFLRALLGEVWDAGIEKSFAPVRLDWKEDSVFPQAPETIKEKPSFDQFEAELNKLKDLYNNKLDSKEFRYSLFHCLQAWGSRMAFQGQQDPFISLFDRNRLLAATVRCISEVKTEGTSGFILLKGGVSGIQQFIYDNIKAEQIGEAKKVAKRLRGRSFFVSHLCQVIAEYIVDVLDMEQANILFVGGGHFNLLLPNTQGIRDQLKELGETLNLGLLHHVGIQLSVHLATEEVSDLLDLGSAFKALGERFEDAKQKRYAGILDQVMLDGNMHKRELNDLEEAGKLAPYASYILEIRGSSGVLKELQTKEKATIRCLQFIGRSFYLFKAERTFEKFLLENADWLAERNCGIYLNRINDTEFIPEIPSIPQVIALGFQYIGKYAPLEKNTQPGNADLMMFEDMAGLYGGELPGKKYRQLAVMRLDVDDLGILFSYGLGKKVSLARIASLSRELHLFFGGYFNKVAEQHHIYVTYSGGDDAFVVGSWWNMILFAENLHKDFTRFIAGNPHLSFSGGIFFCHPHYPVARFAKEGSEQEGLAKAHIADKENTGHRAGKNAIRLFNRTLFWDRFHEMMQFARELEQVTQVERTTSGLDAAEASRKLRRSMLQRFLALIQSSQKDDTEFTFYHNIGRLHGLVARHGYAEKALKKQKNELASRLIEKLLKEMNNSSDRFYDYMVPLQYVLYMTRTMKS